MKKSVLRKILAVALSAAMLCGTGFTTVGQFVGTDVSVNAVWVYGDFEYEFNDDDTITITKYTGNGGEITVPDTIDGDKVTGIKGYCDYYDEFEVFHGAFENCKSLKSIVIPDNVTYISEHAFDGCTSLTSISVRKDNEKYSSFNGVLFNKNKTKIVKCPEGRKGEYTIPDSVTETGSYAFANCTGLTSVVIPDGITEICWSVFEGCTGLTSIVIPDSVTSISDFAFSKCAGLVSIVISDRVTSIGEFAFFGCTSLKSIVIPDSVTSIYGYAFCECTGLTSIVIPDSVTEIGSSAFSDCTSLTIYGVKGSCAETYAKENNIPFVVKTLNKSTISAKEVLLGQTVTVNAKSSEDNCTYAVLYRKKSDTKWTVKQNYSTNDTITIKPVKATDYDVCVKVKNSNGKIVKKFFEVKVNAKLKNTSTISAAEIKKGNSITLHGSATGGKGGYTYAALYKKKSETKWTVRQGYKDNSEIIVRPYTNTDYDICVKVKDNDGTIAKKYFTVTVTK